MSLVGARARRKVTMKKFEKMVFCQKSGLIRGDVSEIWHVFDKFLDY